MSGFVEVVAKVAERRGVDARGLAVRARLHLPRVARSDGTVGRRLALAEVIRSSRHLSADIAAKAMTPKEAAQAVQQAWQLAN